MFALRTAVVTIAAVALVIVGAAVLAVAPLWTGPSLPDGATPLRIAVESPRLPGGCQAALLAPARIASSGDQLVLVSRRSGDVVPVVWPSGFAAWRIDGRAVLAGPYGNVIGRKRDVLYTLGGGVGPDDAFHVCGAGEGLAGLVRAAPWFLLALSVALGIVVVAIPRRLLRSRPGRQRYPPG